MWLMIFILGVVLLQIALLLGWFFFFRKQISNSQAYQALVRHNKRVTVVSPDKREIHIEALSNAEITTILYRVTAKNFQLLHPNHNSPVEFLFYNSANDALQAAINVLGRNVTFIIS